MEGTLSVVRESTSGRVRLKESASGEARARFFTTWKEPRTADSIFKVRGSGDLEHSLFGSASETLAETQLSWRSVHAGLCEDSSCPFRHDAVQRPVCGKFIQGRCFARQPSGQRRSRRLFGEDFQRRHVKAADGVSSVKGLLMHSLFSSVCLRPLHSWVAV